MASNRKDLDQAGQNNGAKGVFFLKKIGGNTEQSLGKQELLTLYLGLPTPVWKIPSCQADISFRGN